MNCHRRKTCNFRIIIVSRKTEPEVSGFAFDSPSGPGVFLGTFNIHN